MVQNLFFYDTIWYTLVIMMQNLCSFGMIQHTLVIIMQNLCFYDMVWHTLVRTTKCVFLWYDTAYLGDDSERFVFL